MTKKISMVVFNSVAQDARVLKEAEALHAIGHFVTIFGIQDANNDVPAEVLENGVAVRRAGWRAEAFKPLLPVFVGRFLGIAVLTGAAIAVLGLVVDLAPSWWRAFRWNWEYAFAIAATVVFAGALIYAGVRISSDYLRLKKSHAALRKKESDALLRYDALLRSIDRKPTNGSARDLSVPPATPDKSPATPPTPKARRRGSRLRFVPRPFLGTISENLSPAGLRKWKVVFARERAVYDLLEQDRPDIVHAHDLSALPVCEKYARRHGVPLVFDAHEIYDHLAQADDDLASLNGALMRKYAASVDLFVTINDSISNYYRHNYPALPRATVVKNATKPAPSFDYDGRLHDAAGLPRDRRILLYQGGFAAKRGLEPLLLSAEHLAPGWTLVFMGWGKFEDEMRSLAEALKVRTRRNDEPVVFVPKVKQSELPYWTAGAAAGVIPYENSSLNHWYCTPNKLWEYPNADVPILVSPFPEMRRVVERYGVGWLLPDPLTPTGIAAAINRLTDEDIAAARAACRAYIADDNWTHHARRLTTAYGAIT